MQGPGVPAKGYVKPSHRVMDLMVRQLCLDGQTHAAAAPTCLVQLSQALGEAHDVELGLRRAAHAKVVVVANGHHAVTQGYQALLLRGGTHPSCRQASGQAGRHGSLAVPVAAR